MSKRKAIIFATFLSLLLAVVYIAVNCSAFGFVHQELGGYGKQIKAIYGSDISGITGIWFMGYDNVESVIAGYGVVNFLAGTFVGVVLLGVLVRLTRKTEEK